MIKVDHLTKRYGSKTALDDVSFSVPRGQVLGLLGLNGAGKSTTMNIIAGCLAPDSGTVTIAGVNIVKNAAAAKRHIGYLPENPPLYVDMKVKDFLSFVYDLKKLRGNRKKALQNVSEKTGVAGVAGRLIKNLSKGYRQRVGLAAALLGDPEALILDEPTVGLDPTQIIEIRNLIGELGEERTVMLSSHILSEIQAVCQRVVVLDAGRVIADDAPKSLESALENKNSCVALIAGDPEKVKAALLASENIEEVLCGDEVEPGAHEYSIRGREGTDVRHDIFFRLSDAGLPLLASRGTGVTLEDVFLRLVTAGNGEGTRA